MKACSHCSEPLADAAARCPRCGVPVDGGVSGVTAQRDEPIGYGRSALVLTAIVVFLALFAAAGIAWFLD